MKTSSLLLLGAAGVGAFLLFGQQEPTAQSTGGGGSSPGVIVVEAQGPGSSYPALTTPSALNPQMQGPVPFDYWQAYNAQGPLTAMKKETRTASEMVAAGASAREIAMETGKPFFGYGADGKPMNAPVPYAQSKIDPRGLVGPLKKVQK